MILAALVTLLQNDAGVSALVSGSIYLSELPRGYTLPAICAHRYNGTQEYGVSGPVGVREDQVQFDIYGPDATTAQQVSEAVRHVLDAFTGVLSDGTKVQACYMERDMDMPFMTHADTKGIANRSVLGYRIVNVPA